jgi:hypothetical protein
MKQAIRLIVLITVSGILFTACKSKTNELGKMIPGNVLGAVHINGKSMASKLSWDEIKQNSWFKEAYNDSATQSWVRKVLDNPENSGINLKGDFVFFVQKIGDDMQVTFEGEVKDAKAFEQFNKNATDNQTVTTDNNLSSMNLKNDGVATWNDKKFVYVINKHVPKYNYFDTTKPAETSNMASVVAFSKSLFNLKADSSLGKNEKFSALLQEEGDIHAWYNTAEAIKSIPMMGVVSMLKMDALLNNIVTYTANFEDGKISVKNKVYGSKEMMDILKKYAQGGINGEMIKNIPSANILGIISFHIKPEGIAEMIKLTGMDGMINMMLTPQGFSMDDFVKATNGDFMVVFTDLNYSGGMSSKEPFTVLFATGIGDKTSFNKLLDAGLKLKPDMNKDSSGIAYAKNDKYFVIGNNLQAVNKYIAGGNSTYSFSDKLKDHPFGMFVDINKILTSINTGQAPKDTADMAMLNASVKVWDNVYMEGGDVNDNVASGMMEVNFIDKKTNSLKQLNSYANQMAGYVKERKKKNEASMSTDSTLMLPPPPPAPQHKKP